VKTSACCALFTEAQLTPVTIDDGIVVADVDDTNLESATVTIASGHQSLDVLALASTPPGVTANYDVVSGVLTINGTATVAEYETMLRNVVFNTASTSPGASRTIAFQVNDGTANSAATNDTRDITITNVNDAPVIGNLSGTVGYTENDAAVQLDGDATVTDSDSPNLTGGTVTITNVKPGDELSSTPQGGVSGAYDSTSGVLTITGSATLAQYTAFVQSVKYRNTSDTPDTEDRTIEFQVDDGEPSNNLSNVATKTVTVTAANDAPVVTTTGGNISYTEGGGPTLVDNAVTVTDADSLTLATGKVKIAGGFHAGDVLTWTNQPGISATFTPGTGELALTGSASPTDYQAVFQSVAFSSTSDDPGSSRSIEFSVDDGAALNHASNTAIRGIDVTAINDKPVNTVPGAQSVDEDTDLTFSSGNGNAISVFDADAGGGDIKTTLDVGNGTLTLGATPAGLTVTGNGTNAVELTGTQAEINTALAGLKYRDALNASGSEVLTVTTSDLGLTPPPAEVDSDNVNITVNPVNDAPVATDETFNGSNSAVRNTTLSANVTATRNGTTDGRMATPDPTDTSPVTDRPHKEITGDILSNDTDVDNANNTLTVVPGTFATDGGGTVTIESDGDFNFEPAPSASCTNTSDFFDYTVSDGVSSGAGPNPGTDTGRVTIALTGCVWYVNNNDAQGNSGTSEKPFDTLAQAETASGTGHSIFVYDGDDSTTGYATGFNLKSGQKLIGESSALTIGPDTLHSADAANRPTITDNNADVVDLDDGNEVRGFNIDPQGTGGGIAGSSGDIGGGTISDVNITDNGTPGTQPAFELDSTTGTFNVSNFVVNSVTTGVRLHNTTTPTNDVSAAFATGPASQISITTNGAPGLDVDGTAAHKVDLGTSQFDDITVASSSNGAVNVTNALGAVTYGDGTGTDLALTTTSGSTPAFGLNTTGTPTVPSAGTSDIHATGGPAVDVVSAGNASLSFDDVDSTTSASDGINLDGLGTGTFNANTGGISDAAGISFDLNGGSGNVTYAGDLNDGSGATAVDVTNRTAGTVTFSGLLGDDSDAGGGINLSSNNDANVTRFDGGVTLSTGASHGVAGSSGGTLAMADPAGSATNVIDTTTGSALNLSSTRIHDDDLVFERLSSSDPSTSGISLTNTSNANGRLIVNGNGSITGPCTGTASSCNGGVINSAGLSGITLASVPGGATLTRMAVTNSGDDGIAAGDVASGMALNNGLVSGSGNAVGDRGLDYDNVRGTSSINQSKVTTSAEDNARWENDNGTLGLTVDASEFSSNSAVSGADGMLLLGDGTATMTANVTNSLFQHNRDDGFQLATKTPNTAQMNVTLTNNDIIQGVNNAPNNAAVHTGPGSNSDTKFKMVGNELRGSLGSALILNPGPDSTSSASYDAIIDGNSIGNATVDSGSQDGIGIWGRTAGNGDNRFLIKNNVVQHYQGQGMYLRGNEGVGQDTDYTVTGNQVINPDGTSFTLLLEAGSVPADSTNVCFDVGRSVSAPTNLATDANTLAVGGTATVGVARDFAANTLTLREYTPGGGTAGLTNYFDPPRNTVTSGTLSAIFSGLDVAGQAGACEQPVNPPTP